MMKKLLLLLLALLMCLGSAAAESVYQQGDKIEDFTVTTWDNKTITLSEVLKEKEMVLINIWASWCGPCRFEFPFMEEAYQQYQDKVEIIALSCEPTDTADVLESFVSELGLTFPVAQDTVDLAYRFNATSIPTSIVVDRYGVICYIHTGALTDASYFTRLFEAFLGEDYTESMLFSDIPPMKPNVAPSAEADLAAALEVSAAANPTGAYVWPMTVTEKDGRTAVASTNQRMDATTSAIEVALTVKAGDALAVTFKLSSEPAFDLMTLRINGEIVKSFGGQRDWTTYAYRFQADGDYTVTVSYEKNAASASGEDTLWVDSIALLTGDAASAAVAASPAYPTSKAASMTITNAREIIIDDPTGVLQSYYGDSRYYILSGDTASLHVTLSPDMDPEAAIAYCNYDSAIYPLIEHMTDDGYTFTAGVDRIDTTGYCNTNVLLYPSMTDLTLAQCVTYFADEENATMLINQLTKDSSGAVLGSWAYADEAQPAASSYTVKYIDQDGNPVSGVMLQVCDESTCLVFVSDENGLCQFSLAPYAWELHTLKLPEGCQGDTETVTLAPAEGGELVFTLTRQ